MSRRQWDEVSVAERAKLVQTIMGNWPDLFSKRNEVRLEAIKLFQEEYNLTFNAVLAARLAARHHTEETSNDWTPTNLEDPI